MLSEYTDDLVTLFSEDVEAAFFRTPGELISKLALYLNDDDKRTSVAAEGYHRIWADGHDVDSRVKQLLEWINATHEPFS